MRSILPGRKGQQRPTSSSIRPPRHRASPGDAQHHAQPGHGVPRRSSHDLVRREQQQHVQCLPGDPSSVYAIAYNSPAKSVDLGNVSVPSLSAGQERTFTSTVTLPSDVHPWGGRQCSAGVVNRGFAFSETNESNNQVYTSSFSFVEAGSTLPDLVVSRAQRDSDGSGGGRLRDGKRDGAQHRAILDRARDEGFRLPQPAGRPEDLVKVARLPCRLSQKTGSQDISVRFTVPASTSPGPYSVSVKADEPNEVAEASEANNLASVTAADASARLTPVSAPELYDLVVNPRAGSEPHGERTWVHAGRGGIARRGGTFGLRHARGGAYGQRRGHDCLQLRRVYGDSRRRVRSLRQRQRHEPNLSRS